MPGPSPDPILPPDLLALTEHLAERTHDTWAEGRRREGWTFGPRRDDDRKQHPGLVPYAELSEGEKQYDRNTALGTLRTILGLGYRILPPVTTAAAPEEAPAIIKGASASGTFEIHAGGPIN